MGYKNNSTFYNIHIQEINKEKNRQNRRLKLKVRFMIIKQGKRVIKVYKGDTRVDSIYKGEDLFYGGRSPYSAEATATLKEAFPNDWITIRDYGFNNADMIPYVNQYPMIVASLAGVARCVMTTNGEAYFNTGIKTTNAQRLEVEAYANMQNRAFIGGRQAGLTQAFNIGWDPNNKFMFDLVTTRINVNGSDGQWHRLVLDRTEKKGYMDDIIVAQYSTGTLSSSYDIYLMAVNNGGSPAYWSGSGLIISYAKIFDGNAEHYYIPCEDNKIIDVATGNVISKIGYGTATFSISSL